MYIELSEEDFLETALNALSPSEEGDCGGTRVDALRISLQRALMQLTGIQLPAAHTAVRHSIAQKTVTEY